ncbi:MAG: DUF1264 domain-containing protein [Gemmataceae bacterium]
MDRREMLGAVGALGVGLAAGSTAKSAVHEEKGKGPLGDTKLAHFCGIHVAKNNPKFQIVTEHYCGPCGDGLHQCLLYDSTKPHAKLLGVEYIVTDEIYQKLPKEEKKYWHPHTYEVLSGGLIAPEMSAEDEFKFMSYIMPTWGKTWHTWPDPSTPVPMGEPLLIWSLMADNHTDKKIVEERDRIHGVTAAKVRADRIAKFGMDVPNVSFPKSMDFIGRQWTDSGDDKPTKK